MMNRVYWLIASALVVASTAAPAIVYDRLPDRIPIHWNVHGEVDGYGPRASAFLTPGIMVGLLVLFLAIPWLSPKRFEIDGFERTYLYVMTITLGMLAYVQAVTLFAALLGNVDVGRAIVGGIFLFFVAIGNVLGKVRRNFFVGIRTPWTLASERVWTDTHRLGAWTMVASGIVGFLLVVVGGMFVSAFVAFMVGVMTPVVYSLIRYKQLERAGET